MSNLTCPICRCRIENLPQAAAAGICPSCGGRLNMPRVYSQPPSARRPNAFDGVLLGVVVVVGIVVSAFLFLPSVRGPRVVPPRSSCSNNLKQISFALLNYHDQYESFPPAYTTADDGMRLHSWRTLLLAFAEYDPLYEQVRLDEPFNSSWNWQLYNDFVPDYYVCPADPDSRCSYFLINVPDGIFDETETTSIDNITDGASNTIMVVEVHGAGIHWTEPRDLGPEALDVPVNFSHNGTCISSSHAGGAMVVCADGRVRFLEDGTSLDTLQALMTKSGGEEVELP